MNRGGTELWEEGRGKGRRKEVKDGERKEEVKAGEKE